MLARMAPKLLAESVWPAVAAFVFVTGCGGAARQSAAKPAGDQVVFELTMRSGGPPLPGVCNERKTTLYGSGRLVESRCDDTQEVGVVPPSRMNVFLHRARDAEDAKREPKDCCDLPNVGCRAWTNGDMHEIESGQACIDLEDIVQHP
jgi:hypothetical protein